MPDRIFAYDKVFTKGQLHLPSAHIIQIAELSLISSGEVCDHAQSCDEITYVISGSATVYYNEHSCKLTKGQIHYIKQGPTHRIVADPDHNFHYCCIGFLPNPEEKSTQPFFQAIRNIDEFVVTDENSISALFNSLLEEFFLSDIESNTMIQCYFCQLLIKLHRILNGRFQKKFIKPDLRFSNQAVYQALKYIDKNYIKITTIKSIAKELSYSEYYLSHIFTEKMGFTMKEYILRKKLTTATELLETTNMSISDVSDQLHFPSPHSFSRVFRNHMNMSPSEFRRASRGE